MRRQAFRAPTRVLYCTFCGWVAGQRLALTECSFADTGALRRGGVDLLPSQRGVESAVQAGTLSDLHGRPLL